MTKSIHTEQRNQKTQKTQVKERTYTLRQHQPGDIGMILHKHGVLYATEYGWDQKFEAMVAQIAADFLRDFDQQRERCWIAEIGEEIVGSIAVAKSSDSVSKLRLFFVDDKARGQGLGQHLVSEVIGFCREVGYKKIELVTDRALKAARHIYSKNGFKLVAEEEHETFGKGLVMETWELAL
ncbi:GNAT family N-acetyltransferase [Caldalkalibacillus salinus]|uniref:GNAT family N-acetyltransferase n=1 Tax=Caldalkalibacillus salinus TaxID=2803787 RepID=UPI0019210C48|nr:GNAT family N-acetyltransferase [Caldalkalibacillus salinus]